MLDILKFTVMRLYFQENPEISALKLACFGVLRKSEELSTISVIAHDNSCCNFRLLEMEMFKRVTRVRKKKKGDKDEGKKGTKDSPKPGKSKKVCKDIFTRWRYSIITTLMTNKLNKAGPFLTIYLGGLSPPQPLLPPTSDSFSPPGEGPFGVYISAK